MTEKFALSTHQVLTIIRNRIDVDCDTLTVPKTKSLLAGRFSKRDGSLVGSIVKFAEVIARRLHLNTWQPAFLKAGRPTSNCIIILMAAVLLDTDLIYCTGSRVASFGNRSSA
jgi:hypothetical protein